MSERKYIAVSIKHSYHDRSKTPILWGYKRTADEENRCFADYTKDINKCELYSLEDFQSHYGNGFIKCDEPVKMCFDYVKRYKKYDTVLVDKDDLQAFLSFI
jgi:hypothetical protein